jgi:hypothetical protein
MARLLAERADVEADAALALERDEAIVERTGAQHRAVECLHFGGRQLRIVARIERSVFAQDLHDVVGLGVAGVARHARTHLDRAGIDRAGAVRATRLALHGEGLSGAGLA